MENKLSVIIPVYNEEKTILEVINRVKKLPVRKEIIIVDDFSTDGTREILKKIKDKTISVLFNQKNYGKGYSIRKAIKKAKGNRVVIQDADLEYNPEEYIKMIKFMQDNNAQAVFGSRALNKNNPYSYLTYYLGNKFLNIITNLIFSSNFTDM